MKIKSITPLLAAMAIAVPAFSSAATLAAGKYVATLSPAPTEDAADKIESRLGKISELRSVDVKPEDASLHFTVKANASVDESKIMEAVEAAASGTTMSAVVSDMGTSTGSSGSSSPSTNY